MPSLTPRHVVLASMLAWLVCVLLQWLTDPPLSHDEAAYALLARDDGHNWVYRPIGTIAIARLGFAFGDSEIALRAVSVVLGLSLVPAVAYLGRRFGAWTGAWAAALVAGCHPFLLRGFQLLNDIPVASCLLVATAIAIDELDRDDGPRYRLVLVAPLCAAAIYVRYGSVLPICVIALAAALLFRSWLRRPGPVAVTVCVLALLIAPLLVYSHASTGSVLGILDAAHHAAARPIGHGLARFVQSNPLLFYGVLVAPVMFVGLFGTRIDRRDLLLANAALVLFVWLGLFSDGSTRFVFVPIVFFVILGTKRLLDVLATRPRGRCVAAALVITSWVVMIAAAVPIQRHRDRWLAGMVSASEAIRADADGQPCVVIAYRVTQLVWYTGCDVVRTPPAVLVELPRDGARWYVTALPGDPVQPDEVIHSLGVQAVPLPGGAAWYLVR